MDEIIRSHLNSLFKESQVIFFKLNFIPNGNMVNWIVYTTKEKSEWLSKLVTKYERLSRRPTVNERAFEQPLSSGVDMSTLLFMVKWSCIVIDEEKDRCYVCIAAPSEDKDALSSVRSLLKSTSPYFRFSVSAGKQKVAITAIVIESKKLAMDFMRILLRDHDHVGYIA